MAYSLIKLQVVGGPGNEGYNANPPGDKVPSGQFLLLQNFRIDREGKLVSRYGYVNKFQVASPGFTPSFAHSAAVYGGVEGAYYVAATEGTMGVVIFNFEYPPIFEGLDTNRVGMVPLNGFMWIMNRLAQGKHSLAQGAQPWGVMPPLAACVAAVGGADPNGPSGTYQYYYTYELSDLTLESNPSPVSNSVSPSLQDVSLTNIGTCPQAPPPGVSPITGLPFTWFRNIYATGGELGQPYLVGTISDNTTSAFNVTISDLLATDGGQVMPTTNDPPPPAAGMCGPYFGRLIAWSSLKHPSRIWWTDPDLPQYWPGSLDDLETEENWADIGTDGESVVWCSMHTGVLVIYKERSIWELVGDPDSGYLQQVHDGLGLVNAWALAPAGMTDYFVAPTGLFLFNLDIALDGGEPVKPIFTTAILNQGSLTPPGSILPPPAYQSGTGNALNCYWLAIGFALGKLYVAYAENSTTPNSWVMLVYDEKTRRWAYHRNAIGGGLQGFNGFVYDGLEMVGLCGEAGGHTVSGYSLDDFRAFYTQDPGAIPIELAYQSHFEDGGQPNNQKNWLEVVVDYNLAGDTLDVYASADNGNRPLQLIGQIKALGRGQASFPVALNGKTGLIEIRNPAVSTQLDLLAKNLSVAIYCQANALVEIHNVYLYCYVEAHLAMAASTLASDLGVGKDKECKELELDIDASGGAVDVNVYSDLPGNALAVRQTPVVNGGGRAVRRYPFSVLNGVPDAYPEGYLWRLLLTATAGAFRLYSARLLMRVVGVYVEAYESTAGFVWESMPETFESLITKVPRLYAIALAAIPIKRVRELSIQINTFGTAVTLTLLSDLPGNSMQKVFSTIVNTGAAGRRFVRIPLPNGDTAPWLEGRMFQLNLGGNGTFKLYEAAIEILAMGVYIEAYEAAGGAIYDSRENDFGSPLVKECTELELDIETTGPCQPQLVCDVVAAPALAPVSTAGRQKVLIPLTLNAATGQYAEGRFPRLFITSANAFRLYDARLRVRIFSQYLLAAETGAGALWDSTVIDLGSNAVKQLRELQLDIWAYANYVVTVYTDLPGNVMVSRVVSPQFLTSGRTNVMIPLPQGLVPDNYTFGRLVRVTITSAGAFKLFGARIDARPIGCYVETYEATDNPAAVWDSTPIDFGDPQDKMFDQIRFEMDSDGATALNFYTDLPGEVFTSKVSVPLTTAATSRHWQTIVLPAGADNAAWSVEGRSMRAIVSGTAGFRLYKAQVRHAKIGRYLAAGVGDQLSTLEFDFQSERVKTIQKIEIDLRADGNVTCQLLTSQSDQMAVEYTLPTITTPNGRKTHRVNVPPGIRGRLMRVVLSSAAAARIFKVRLWVIPLNEPKAEWSWIDYPCDTYDVLPAWADLPVPPTPPGFQYQPLPVPATAAEWAWGPFPVNPTPPGSLTADPAQWQWGKFLEVEETSNAWAWVDLSMGVS